MKNEKILFTEESYTDANTGTTGNETLITETNTAIEPEAGETGEQAEQGASQTGTKGDNEIAKKTEPQTLFEVVENKPNGEEKTEQEQTAEEIKKERKKGSGRKPLPRDENGNIIKPTGEQQPEKKADELEDFLKGYKEDTAAPVVKTGEQPNPVKIIPLLDVSKFINGAVFLLVMDAIFPTLLLFLMEFINPKFGQVKDSARKKLKLDKEERALLEEGANEIVKYVFADANPMLVFTISVGFIYYSKIDSLEDSDFIKKELQPRKKPTVKDGE